MTVTGEVRLYEIRTAGSPITNVVIKQEYGSFEIGDLFLELDGKRVKITVEEVPD